MDILIYIECIHRPMIPQGRQVFSSETINFSIKKDIKALKRMQMHQSKCKCKTINFTCIETDIHVKIQKKK